MKIEASPETTVLQEPKTGHLSRVFRAFSYRDFRLLWFGAFTSSAGTWLQETALGWFILQLTNQSFYLGLNNFLGTAPILLFSLIGGVVADRFDRRRILLTSQYLQLIFAFVLAVLAALETIPAWHLIVYILLLSFLTGCAQAFGGPAYQALIPALVERRDLANAIALNSIQFNLARVVGPSIGGIALTYFGVAICFGLNGLSFIAVIAALSLLSVRHIPRTGNSKLHHELRGGLSFVWTHEALRSLTLLSFACTFLGTPVSVFMAVFARDIFKMGPGGYSSLMTVSGAGAVAGALFVAWLGDLKHKGQAALLMQVLLGVIIIAFTFAPNVWVAYPLIFLAGVFIISVFALISSLIQLLVADEMRGRVMSIYMVAFRGGMPLGSLATGLLVNYFSLPHIVALEGLLLSLLAGYYLISRSQMKEH